MVWSRGYERESSQPVLRMPMQAVLRTMSVTSAVL